MSDRVALDPHGHEYFPDVIAARQKVRARAVEQLLDRVVGLVVLAEHDHERLGDVLRAIVCHREQYAHLTIYDQEWA